MKNELSAWPTLRTRLILRPGKRQESFEQRLKSAALQVAQHRKLWNALSDYIHSNGCFLVSPPSKYLRIEVPRGSALPAKLTELGYSPRKVTIGTRIQAGALLPVDVIEISLKGK
jgi:hypothetical protein